MRVGEPLGLGPGLVLACVLACGAGPMRAQQLIGYVSTRDADVGGATDVVDGNAVLAGSVSVTAKDHTAPIRLGRGGTVNVCQTSVLHLTESRAVEVAAPLLFSLYHGAIEIEMSGTASDAIMTPDLRFTVRSGGPLDLRLRVARNGDTCVENRGPEAPTLAVSDPFGESMYELHAGQHVLFEHGSLHEVVDHESSPCGCPDARGMSVAEALLAPGGANSRSKAAEAMHPFPAAVSEGLAPAAEVPQAPPGEVHAQVSDTLSYNAADASAPSAGSASGQGGVPSSTAEAAGTSAGASTGAAQAHPPAQAHTSVQSAESKPAHAPPAQDLVHVIGRFFHKLFGHS
jgi:hypothetical protein